MALGPSSSSSPCSTTKGLWAAPCPSWKLVGEIFHFLSSLLSQQLHRIQRVTRENCHQQRHGDTVALSPGVAGTMSHLPSIAALSLFMEAQTKLLPPPAQELIFFGFWGLVWTNTGLRGHREPSLAWGPFFSQGNSSHNVWCGVVWCGAVPGQQAAGGRNRGGAGRRDVPPSPAARDAAQHGLVPYYSFFL